MLLFSWLPPSSLSASTHTVRPFSDIFHTVVSANFRNNTITIASLHSHCKSETTSVQNNLLLEKIPLIHSCLKATAPLHISERHLNHPTSTLICICPTKCKSNRFRDGVSLLPNPIHDCQLPSGAHHVPTAH